MKFNTEFAETIFKSKYMFPGEDKPFDSVKRVMKAVQKYSRFDIYDVGLDYIDNKWFLPGGSIWRAAGNPDQNVSAVNCTTLGHVEDNLESIFSSLYMWAKCSAFGQGNGIDISKLRPEGFRVRNTAKKSTGGNSFIPLYDFVIKVIAQEGRRGATLISICDHYPDIVNFCKLKLEKGQAENSNLSIQITDHFMRVMEEDGMWNLKWKSESQEFVKEIYSRELFNTICECTWKAGDPGFLFIDRIREESNSDVLGYPVECTNACSEVPSDIYNVCILGSINLAMAGCKNGFSPSDFKDLISFGIVFLDAVRLMEYTERRSPLIAQRNKLLHIPRIGLGITGFADYLVNNKVKYGSDMSVKFASAIASEMAEVSYEQSYDIAKKEGRSFPAYSKKLYMKSEYIKRLLSEKIIDEKVLDYQAHVCKLAIAPAGTLSIIAECGGSGIECFFSKYMVRRERATTGEWKEWFIFNPAVEKALIDNKYKITRENAERELVADFWVTAYSLDYKEKIKVIKAFQKYIDQGISVTFNIKENSPISEVKNIFINAWESGLKGVAIYREGSRDGVMITEENYDKTKRYRKRILDKRPKSLPATIFYEGGNCCVIIGFKDGKPYEIFGGIADAELPFDSSKGNIIKESSRVYKINGIDILQYFKDPNINSITRMISLSLRHKVHLQFVVDQLRKEIDFGDITEFFARILSKFLVDEEVLGETSCPSCNNDVLVYRGGCKTCIKCGWSICG